MNSSSNMNSAFSNIDNFHLPQTPKHDFRARINKPYDMNAFLDEASRRLEHLEMPHTTRPPLSHAQVKHKQYKLPVLNDNWEASRPVTNSRFIKAEAISHEKAKERLSIPRQREDFPKADLENFALIEVPPTDSTYQGFCERVKKASARLPLSRTFMEHKRKRSEELQGERRILGQTSGNSRVRGINHVSERFPMTP